MSFSWGRAVANQFFLLSTNNYHLPNKLTTLVCTKNVYTRFKR